MSLGSFTPTARIDSDKVRADSLTGRPLLVRVQSHMRDFVSQAYPTPKDVVTVDVVDLTTGQIHIGPLWGAGKVVDNLAPYAGTGTVLPLKLMSKIGQSQRAHLDPQPLEGAELAMATQWWNTYPTAVDSARAAKEAQANAAQPGAAPLAPQPIQGMVPPAPAAPTTYAAPAAPVAPAAPAPAPAPAAPVAYAPPVPAPAAPLPAAPVAPVAAPAAPAAWQPTPEQIAQYMASQQAAAQAAPTNPTPPPAPTPAPAPVAPTAPAPQPASGVTPDQIQAAIAALQSQQ